MISIIISVALGISSVFPVLFVFKKKLNLCTIISSLNVSIKN